MKRNPTVVAIIFLYIAFKVFNWLENILSININIAEQLTKKNKK